MRVLKMSLHLRFATGRGARTHCGGVGNEVTINLGGKMDMLSIDKKGEPRQVTGRMKVMSGGLYRNLGPADGLIDGYGADRRLRYRQSRNRRDLPSARAEGQNAFLSLGIDPARKKYNVEESRTLPRRFPRYRKGSNRIAGTGVCFGL